MDLQLGDRESRHAVRVGRREDPERNDSRRVRPDEAHRPERKRGLFGDDPEHRQSVGMAQSSGGRHVMKVQVLFNDKGKAVATVQPQRSTGRSASAKAPTAQVVENAGQRFQELDLPPDFAKIEDAGEFHAKLAPYLAKMTGAK